MTKLDRIRLGAALALSLSALSAPAAAQEPLAARAIAAMADTIATQGNAALVQIRAELREQLADTLKPYLPARDDDRAPAPAERPQQNS